MAPVRKKKRRRKRWEDWPEERLLNIRMCNLGLTIRGTVLEEYIEKIRDELEYRDLRLKPYFWLSDDWFTPGDLTGTAIPFYLAHPRMVRLERKQIGSVEGGTRKWCLKILRHEVGHALCHAYQLQRRTRWKKTFGPSSRHYPSGYRPNPYSKKHVMHLEYWYAQAHPDEDFAETFAVWLKPRSQWRAQYQGWPALAKLEYVNELMQEIAGKKPLVSTRERIDSLPHIEKTLREHYAWKKRKQSYYYTGLYDHLLWRYFCKPGGSRVREPASTFIIRMRPVIMGLASEWNGDYRFQLEHVLRDMISRSRELGLYLSADVSGRTARKEYAVRLIQRALDSFRRNRQWVNL